MLAAIRRGRSIGVLVDQRYDAGELVELCGRPASAPIGPALLATRLRLPFVPVRCERIGPCRFRITIEPPLAPRPGLVEPRDKAKDLMRQLHRHFERDAERRNMALHKRRWPKGARHRRIPTGDRSGTCDTSLSLSRSDPIVAGGDRT